jgi:uncharacterized protein with von Willebrand factor type A (vWA) domain
MPHSYKQVSSLSEVDWKKYDDLVFVSDGVMEIKGDDRNGNN